MSFDTSWNVDEYKTEFESDEHWELRRNFMIAHKDKYPEERLVCLAQVFFNVEFMGCSYPKKTMKLIKKLSVDIAADHREKQKTRLQRTFVKFSDVAEARIKGTKRPLDDTVNQSDTESSNCKKTKIDSTESTSKKVVTDPLGNTFQTSSTLYNSTDYNESKKEMGNLRKMYGNFTVSSEKTITVDEITKTSGPFGNAVLFYQDGEHPSGTIQRFASMWSLKYKQECAPRENDNMVVATVYLNDVEIGKGVKSSAAKARQTAFFSALNKLMETYFTVKVKHRVVGGNEVVKTTGNEKTNASFESSDVNQPLDADNIGSKLLKMMGWSGGGLGKSQQGIIEPIKASGAAGRSGFGRNTEIDEDMSQNQIKEIKTLIRDFSRDYNNCNDLVFSSEFSKEQRSIFHEYAQRLKLKSKSYGTGENRHLVISKKLDIWTIIRGLVENSGGMDMKYELLRPGVLNVPEEKEEDVVGQLKLENSNCAMEVFDDERITMDEVTSTSGPFGRAVLFLGINEFALGVIRRFAKMWNLKFTHTSRKVDNNSFVTTIHLNNIEVGKSIQKTKRVARKQAFLSAIRKLQEYYFTVKAKHEIIEGSEVITATGKEKITNLTPVVEDGVEGSSKKQPVTLPDTFGSKILKMMGWSGGGLGKNQQGITEPIKAYVIKGRSGFGNSEIITKIFDNKDYRYTDNLIRIEPIKAYVKKGNSETEQNTEAEISKNDIEELKLLIHDFSKDVNNCNDLVFSADFSNKHRKIFHEYAQTLKLKSKSIGKGKKRHLTISKNYDIWTIVKGLVENSGGMDMKYELIRPRKVTPVCES